MFAARPEVLPRDSAAAKDKITINDFRMRALPLPGPWRKEDSKWRVPHRKFSVLLLFFAVVWRLEAVL